MPNPYKSEAWIGSFIASLHRLIEIDDRATLAKLRRGLGKPVGQAAERDVWLFAHLYGAAPAHEDAAATIASLYASWHQGGKNHANGAASSLGGSFRQLADEERHSTGKKFDEPIDSIEKRFAFLLNADAEDLPSRLRHAVSLLKSKNIPIDWRPLLDDILRWDSESRPVQRRWARDFWAARTSDDQPQPTILPDQTEPEIPSSNP